MRRPYNNSCGVERLLSEKGKNDASGGLVAFPAGEFSGWLSSTEASMEFGTGGADVPCGACRGCCRSSMFIQIKPEETQALNRIPRELLFEAPGLPEGHLLMGYTDQGNCPMLVDNECSIYEDRPQTCRDYDCRIYAATGIRVNPRDEAEIAKRVDQWAFDYRDDGSREEHRIVKAAAAFLRDNRDLFPKGWLPGYPVELAALTVTIYRIFAELTAMKGKDEDSIPDAVIAQEIVRALG